MELISAVRMFFNSESLFHTLRVFSMRLALDDEFVLRNFYFNIPYKFLMG
jgi:hypothetical protein